MNSSLNSFSGSSSSTHSIFTSPKSSHNHRRVIITSALRRHFRRRPHRHIPEKSISINPNSPQSDSNKFQLVIDLQHYTPLSFKKFLTTSQFKFNQFVHSGTDAFDDLRTLISYDNDRRVVISCEKSTLRFIGNSALLGLIIVVSFRILLKLASGFSELFRHREGGGGVIMRRDRSLGGKLVAVGNREEMNREVSRVPLNPLSSDEEILEGVSDTLTKNRSRKSLPPKLPIWWPVSHTPPSVVVDKQEYQRRANRLLLAIMDYELSGKDVPLEDIILLRRVCRESGARVFFDATNSRDSFYRASIDFVLKICISMASQSTFVQIDGEDAREFITGLAENIGLEKIRAARMVAAAVAARTRARLLQAWALEMQDNHSEAVVELMELCFIHRIFPPEEGSPEMEMVARGLANQLKLEQREYLLEMVTEVCFEESRRSLAEALGLDAGLTAGKAKRMKTRGSLEAVVELWQRMPDISVGGRPSPRRLVYASGLGVFVENLAGVSDTRKNKSVFLGLSEYWWDTTHTFHLSWGEVTVTPTDFAAITGLSFKGEPVRWRDMISDDVLTELLGFEPRPRRGLGMLYSDVEMRITASIGAYIRGTGQVTAEQLARSFLWYALSETLFSNHATAAPFALLESLTDLDRVCDIAWGEAGLAELYFSLDRFSRGVANSLACFDFALEVWFYEVFQCFPWDRDPGAVAAYPAMLGWARTARRRRTSRGKLTIAYGEVQERLERDSREGFVLFPWARYEGDEFEGAPEVTAQRKMLRGLTCDAMYLGERVFWQHGPGVLPVAPRDPPFGMFDSRDMDVLDFERYLGGVGAEEFILFGEEYETFVRRKLRTPQVLAREREAGPQAPPEVPMPGPDFTYVRGDGSRRRVSVPVPEQAPAAYRVDPDRSVPGRAYDALTRRYVAMRSFAKKMASKMSCRSSRRMPAYEPMPSRHSVDVPPPRAEPEPQQEGPSRGRHSMDAGTSSGAAGPSREQPFYQFMPPHAAQGEGFSEPSFFDPFAGFDPSDYFEWQAPEGAQYSDDEGVTGEFTGMPDFSLEDLGEDDDDEGSD